MNLYIKTNGTYVDTCSEYKSMANKKNPNLPGKTPSFSYTFINTTFAPLLAQVEDKKASNVPLCTNYQHMYRCKESASARSRAAIPHSHYSGSKRIIQSKYGYCSTCVQNLFQQVIIKSYVYRKVKELSSTKTTAREKAKINKSFAIFRYLVARYNVPLPIITPSSAYR